MKLGDQPITWTPTQSGRDALLSYNISWVAGCTTDTEEQSVQTPVDGTTCKQLLSEDFSACESPVSVLLTRSLSSLDSHTLTSTRVLGTGNEGVGGWRQAGCLQYDFLGHDGG